MDTSLDYLFDDYFDNVNLNDELKSFYDFINNDELNESFFEEKKLTDIRNENYKRYNDINMLEIENLSDNLNYIVNEIKKLYGFIDPERILNNTKEEAEENKKILDLIYNHLNQLYENVKKELTELEQENNKRQEKIKNINYKNVDKKTLEIFLNKYNDLVLYNSVIEDNLFDNYKRQLKRKKYINVLYKLINIETDIPENNINILNKINNIINNHISNIYEKITYLEDLMMEKSKYESEFLIFKEYFKSIIAYDDNDYNDSYRVYDYLNNQLKIKSTLNYFEDSFIEEREEIIKEESFIYEKYGIKNIKTSLNYISANYIDFINEEEKSLINYLYEKINSDNYDIDEIYNRLNLLVSNIWKREITEIYYYNENENFCFICTNNQFIDEKHESILITRKMLERVTDYSNYQIGFICNFNKNIMYITENDDIMTVDYNDMSNLKTPKQLEQEFLNFKVSNRIALNGYLTKIEAVYFINDGDIIKYKKAVNLANQYNLPLIILKKDKN